MSWSWSRRFSTSPKSALRSIATCSGCLFLVFSGQPERRLVPYKGLKFRVAEFSDVVWEFAMENDTVKALKQRDPSGEFT